MYHALNMTAKKLYSSIIKFSLAGRVKWCTTILTPDIGRTVILVGEQSDHIQISPPAVRVVVHSYHNYTW